MTNPTPLRAVALIRMSDDKQAFSPDRQRSMFAEYCARWGLTAAGEYTDEGVSATHVEFQKRAGLMAMVDDARQGRFKLVWCEMVDRIARKGWEFGLVRELLGRHGVAIVRDRDNPLEAVDDADREFMQDLDAILARREVRKTSARVRSAQRRRLALGFYRGGSLPLGLAWEWTADKHAAGRYIIEPGGAVAVTRLMELYAETGSSMETARRLQAEGVPSASGKPWLQSAVMYLLHNPVYRGRIRYGEDLIEADLPEIVPAAIVAQVDAQLQRSAGRPRRATGSITKHTLFSGLLRCPECGAWLGASMASKPDGRHYYTYRCRCAYYPPHLCGWRRHVPQLGLERAIVPQLVARLRALGAEPSGHRRRAQDKSGRREQLEQERKRIVGLHVRGRIPEEEADRMLDDLARRVAALEDEPVVLQPSPARVRKLLAVLESAWDDLTVPEQRGILQEWIEHVIPVPGRGRLQESLITWRWQ